MQPLLIRIFFVVALILSFSALSAQIDLDSDFDKDKEDPKERRILHIIRKDTRKVPYGNVCFEEVTHSMGFEYVLQTKGNQGYRNEFDRVMHNFAVKTGIMFRNGPFWRLKVNKKRKECMEYAGDVVH